MDESKQQQQSLDSLKEPDNTTSPADEEDDYDEELDEVDDDDDDDGDDGGGEFRVEQRKQLSEPPKAEAREKFETLASESLSEKDFKSYLAASSHLLSEVPVDYALLRPLESPNFKDQVGKSHQQALESVMSEAAQSQAQLQNEVTESPQCPTSSSELSPTSVTQSISSGPTNKKLSLVANTNNACTPEMVRQNSFNRRSILSSDGYNWRKYGQKQVKIPQGSRSYYRCTYSECHAKKIEFCDTSNNIIEITSKGEHSHEPPRRINCTKESRLSLPAAPNSPNITAHTVRVLNDPDPSTSSREVIQETPVLPETKQQNCIGSNGTADADIKEEHVDEPEPKRRLKKGKTAYSGPLCKPGKKPKIVVHAAGDVGISGDGYRWRKYGQKMVKGNPHPRNYYRCTSAGCPVRKHVERAVDSTTALIITYKGVHDHDKPVPKKRHGPPSAPLVAATAPASMNTNSQFKDTERAQKSISPIQCSVDKGGGVTSEAMDTGEEKAIESARTLLSIGFEIKQC